MIRDIDTGEWVADHRTMEEVAFINLHAAKHHLIWITQEFYSAPEFFDRLRNANAVQTTQWLLKFGCSWCGERATHNLNTPDMCCDNHYVQYFDD